MGKVLLLRVEILPINTFDMNTQRDDIRVTQEMYKKFWISLMLKRKGEIIIDLHQNKEFPPSDDKR